MPRRNLWLLGTVIVVCLACSMRVDRYAGVLGFAMNQVEKRSLKPVDARKLFEGALSGMVRTLRDPHSIYMEPEGFS